MSAQDALTLLRTQSLTTVVHNELERRIIDGSLLPGAPLRETSIATELGISRGPVREAFRMLEERGLVQFEKNCGVRVRQLALEHARQIYQIRLPLEGLIAELATAALDDSGREQLIALLQAMKSAAAEQDSAAYTLLNFQLHDRLAQLSGNQALHDTYRRLVVQLKLLRSHSLLQLHRLEVSFAEHRAVVEAMIKGDATEAACLLKAHTQASLQRIELAIEMQKN